MGKKIHPAALRVVKYGWDKAMWIDRKNSALRLKIDYDIRSYIDKHVGKLSYAKVVIEQIIKKIVVTIHTHKPGLIIGKKGEAVDRLKGALCKLTNMSVEVNIQEVNDYTPNARLICASIVEKMEARMDYRKAIRFALKNVMKSGIDGCLIVASGRLNGSSICRVEKYKEGKVSLQSICCRVEMEAMQAKTIYGICGVKVYISYGRGKV